MADKKLKDNVSITRITHSCTCCSVSVVEYIVNYYDNEHPEYITVSGKSVRVPNRQGRACSPEHVLEIVRTWTDDNTLR